jgi:hypothetical protein
MLALYAIALGRNTPHGMFDFRIFRHAGAAVLAGHSPWSVHGFVYPAPAALAFVPFAALPYGVAAALYAVLATAALATMLWVLDVRDWRCYAAVFVSFPAMTSVSTGTVSGVVALAAALVWRFRDRRWIAGAALGGAIALKIVLWPLLVWLVLTRRIRATMASLATTGLLLAVSLAIVGSSTGSSLGPSSHYALNTGGSSYSAYALLLDSGLSQRSASLISLAVGVALLLASVRAGDERRSFTLAVAAALVATPVVWIHYLVLLFVPIAIFRPRLSLVWWLPSVLLVLGSRDGAYGSIPSIVLVLALCVSTLALAARATRAADSLGSGAQVR